MIEKVMTIVYTIAILVLLDISYFSLHIVDYDKTVSNIQGSKISGNIIGLMAYIVMAYCIVYIAKTPQESAILGFVIYSIFNLTNMYMFTNWDFYTATMDTLWGVSLFYLTKSLLTLIFTI